jgi:hypothetical protein
MPTLSRGQKVELRDGKNFKFAVTHVMDQEPAPPDEFNGEPWPGNRGDYTLVLGGTFKSGHEGNNRKKMLKIQAGWEDVVLFPKYKKNTKYHNWPGVLQEDFSHFKQDMTPADLLSLTTFLVDTQHINAWGAKKSTGAKNDQPPKPPQKTAANKKKKK